MTWSSSEKPFGKSKVVFFYIHNIRHTERFWVYADNKITRHLSPHSRKLNKHIVFGPRSVPTAFRIKNIWLRRCERVLIVSQSILCFSHVRDLSKLFQSFSFMFARIWAFRIAGPKSSKLRPKCYVLDVFLMFAWKIYKTQIFSKNTRGAVEQLASTGEHWRAFQDPCRATGEHWRALASKWSCWVSYRFFPTFALFQVFWFVLCVFLYFACYFMFCMCFIVFAGFVLFLRRYAKNNVRTVAIDVLGYFFPCGLFFDES